MRRLQRHEQKLLKKVDPYHFKREDNVRELAILRRYRIQNREDYTKYNIMVLQIKKVTHRLIQLDPASPFRQDMTEQLLAKLYNLGLIPTKKSLLQCSQITASSFCRRRLPVVMVRLRMATSLKEAITYIEQGHIRVGPNIITDPAFLVTRTCNDFVTWTDGSKIREKIMKWNDKLDDFDLLGL
eukprot:TRINITY_DN23780_c0_g1_i1.p1 TRINITY_DN23780_c0_g1~~TRINITY_DN23780_c0_g1_i1.p1  ORF type:complete len:184 (-),score=20.38 TRINITY_DN23780_c0_g1_i1:89-640(-)